MRIFILLFLLLYVLSSSYPQSRSDLENKRKSSLKDIKYTNKLIKINEKNRKSSYSRLLLLNRKITSRKDLITSYSDEIIYLNSSIEIHKEIIIGLEIDLNVVKNEYAKIIYYSFLNQNKYDKIMFILASDNINTAFKRLKYFQQYTEYRVKQAKKIEETRQQIKDKIIDLDLLKSDRGNLLVQEKAESDKLIVEKKVQNRELNNLSSKDRELKSKLRKQNRIAQRLQKEIARIIEEEARKAAARSTSNSKEFFKLTPEEKLISDNFSKNRNRLPWPTVRGVVTIDFGEQPHPFLKGIKIRNDGIDISTTEGSIVRSVYDGTVSRIFAITGAHKTVIIRHGNYLTVYSNLKSVIVNQGDKVTTKQNIGVVYTENDKDHETVLQFQIWKDIVKLNPNDWLANGHNK